MRRESHARFYERLAVKFRRPTHPFGPYRYRKDGHWYLGTGPSKKSLSRVRQKVGEVLKPSNVQPWAEVRAQLKRVLRGGAAYFHQGTRLMAYGAIDHPV